MELIESKYKEMNFRVRMGLKLTSDVVDQNKESMRLAKIKAIYEMQYGFDIYQIQDWGYKNKNNKTTTTTHVTTEVPTTKEQ